MDLGGHLGLYKRVDLDTAVCARGRVQRWNTKLPRDRRTKPLDAVIGGTMAALANVCFSVYLHSRVSPFGNVTVTPFNCVTD